MRNKLAKWEWIGFLFTAAAGVAGHFLYDWSGRSAIVAAFAAVNESTWEHMKLLFVPVFLFTMLEFIVFAESFQNCFAAKAAAML